MPIIDVANNPVTIQAAHDDAGTFDGDTLRIAGTSATWTSQVAITKGITLSGVGPTTVITDNITKDGSPSSAAILLTSTASKQYRLTNFKFIGQADDPGQNGGHIQIFGDSTSPNIRIDTIEVESPQCSWIRTYSSTFGLIDHIDYTVNWGGSPTTTLIFCEARAWHGDGDYGDGSWAAALTPGGFNAWYVENCQLSYQNGHHATAQYIMDMVAGARLVIRNNEFQDCTISSHGVETSGRMRSYRWVEIYNNHFHYTQTPSPMLIDKNIWMRGGSGIIANNTVTGGDAVWGWNFFTTFTNFRTNTSYAPWGRCNGSSPYDTEAGDPDGYRCVDQCGSGTSNLLSGFTPPEEPVGNALEPYYVWGNSLNATPTQGDAFGVASEVAHIEENRDYYVDTARPGYAFAGVHPLSGTRKTKRARAGRRH